MKAHKKRQAASSPAWICLHCMVFTGNSLPPALGGSGFLRITFFLLFLKTVYGYGEYGWIFLRITFFCCITDTTKKTVKKPVSLGNGFMDKMSFLELHGIVTGKYFHDILVIYTAYKDMVVGFQEIFRHHDAMDIFQRSPVKLLQVVDKCHPHPGQLV